MPLRPVMAAILCAAVVVGCGGSGDAGKTGAISARGSAQTHPDARFLVDYAGAPYRVDVRFVDIISESVIVVRQGAGKDTAKREAMDVTPSLSPPGPGTPFGDRDYSAVALDIADSVIGRPPICVDGQSMKLARNDAAEARTLYRGTRRAWVVFAFCPPPVEG